VVSEDYEDDAGKRHAIDEPVRYREAHSKRRKRNPPIRIARIAAIFSGD
jgi:hypothetical protein